MSEVQLEMSSSNLEEIPEYMKESVLNHTQAWKFIFTSLGLDVNN
jgi:hypothetical protein